jgi:sugar phosphate isomerase/epimerase
MQTATTGIEIFKQSHEVGFIENICRQEARAQLYAIDLPLKLPHSPANWPIGAAMLQFPSVTATGKTVREAGPERWFTDFTSITAEGFQQVEVPSTWLPIGEMEKSEHEDLKAVLKDVGLSICGTSVARRSIIEKNKGDENLALTHRAIDAAAAVGSPLVCLGLHEELQQSQLDVTWFWTKETIFNPADPDIWKKAVSGFRELCDHAKSVGVELSLELYEGTYLGTPDSAVAFLHDIDRDNIGLNPDIGNLVRAQQVAEPWESMAVKTCRFANYWHVKNYARAELPGQGIYLSTPTPMMSGIIDYRKAIAFAVAHGYKGAFLCENYGGDGLSVSAGNRLYIQNILRSIGGL